MASILNILFWAPKRCRVVDSPRPFTTWLNLLYALVAGFYSANLYYSHPILHILARDFRVDQSQVANIPTLATAGDAAGILLIIPLADFIPRRRFALALCSLTSIFWFGLCITNDLTVFMALTFLSSLFTGIVQILIPLVAELAPPEKRAFAISIVGTGPTMAILLARILAGIVANYTAWRNIYWLSLGLQLSVLILLWLFMPDYPAINKIRPGKLARTYPQIIWSIIMLYVRNPALVQSGLLVFCTFFTVSSYWTTLTFLLAEAPYNYSTLVIGLFGLIGAATLAMGPLFAKYIIQPLNQPLYSTVIGKTVSLIGIVIGTFVGVRHVAGPAIQALLLDGGLMLVFISCRMAIDHIEPLARNRVNTALILLMYLGSGLGTKMGNVVFQQHGGWLASGGLSIGMIILSYLIILCRGPLETRWIGWKGGWPKRAPSPDEEKAAAGEQSSESGVENEKQPRLELIAVPEAVRCKV